MTGTATFSRTPGGTDAEPCSSRRSSPGTPRPTPRSATSSAGSRWRSRSPRGSAPGPAPWLLADDEFRPGIQPHDLARLLMRPRQPSMVERLVEDLVRDPHLARNLAQMAAGVGRFLD